MRATPYAHFLSYLQVPRRPRSRAQRARVCQRRRLAGHLHRGGLLRSGSRRRQQRQLNLHGMHVSRSGHSTFSSLAFVFMLPMPAKYCITHSPVLDLHGNAGGSGLPNRIAAPLPCGTALPLDASL